MSSPGERLRELREKAGLEQDKLAFRCGWTGRTRISNYESNERNPRIAELALLEEAFLPFHGPGSAHYIITGKRIQEQTPLGKTGSFTKEDALTEFRSLLRDLAEFGRIKLEPGLKLSDLVENFSKRCSSYIHSSDSQKSA